jgi:Cdc6-like AAA superfamily ATPase
MDIVGYFGVKTRARVKEYLPLSQRYTPTRVSDFIDNYRQIKEIDEWFCKEHTKHLVVLGPTGSGKTSLVRLLCDKYNKTIYLHDSFVKRTKNDLNRYYQGVKGFVKQGVFVFDEMEHLVTKSESVSITEIDTHRLYMQFDRREQARRVETNVSFRHVRLPVSQSALRQVHTHYGQRKYRVRLSPQTTYRTYQGTENGFQYIKYDIYIRF